MKPNNGPSLCGRANCQIHTLGSAHCICQKNSENGSDFSFMLIPKLILKALYGDKMLPPALATQFNLRLLFSSS